MSNEDQIRDALRGVADAGGPPDEGAAWERIAGGIAADGRAAGRRRWLAGGAGLAIAGAAAALVLVVGAGDDEEAVEVGPAAESTTTTTQAVVPVETTTSTTTAPSVGPPSTVADHPIAVVVEGGLGQRIDVYDADTGELLHEGITETAFSFSDLSIVGPLLYFTEEGGDSETVRVMPLDGSAEPTTPFGLPSVEEESTRSGDLSPDGSTFAYVEQGVIRNEGRIVLVDTTTQERRYLEWADDEDDFFLTQGRISDLEWSPDGAHLVFVSNYEGEEFRLVDVAEDRTLSDSESVGGGGRSPAWADEGAFVAVRYCCFPDVAEQGGLMRIRVVGEMTIDNGTDDDLLRVEIAGGWVALLREDGTVEAGDKNGTIFEPLPIAGTVVEIGL